MRVHRLRLARARVAVAVAVAAVAVAVVGTACTGDDETFRAEPVYSYDAASFDRAPPPAEATDATTPSLSCGDAGDAPPRLLLVHREQPELAALNLTTLAVDGRFTPDGGGVLLTSTAANRDPWLVDRAHDLVIRLDAREPWRPLGTWDLRGDDGDGSSDPAVVVQVSCTKAYVIRKGRDRIAIIDPSQSGGGGLPSGYVDLSPFHSDGDVSGTLELTSAVWVPAKKKVFVLAGNIQPGAVTDPFGLTCTPLEPLIFAIDIATDTVVSLAGKGPAGSIELTGYDAISLLYDAPFDRLLALSAGCFSPGGDGGAGEIRRRGVEQVDLATGAVKPLLALDGPSPPTGLALLDGDHAVLTFANGRAVLWNPREPSLGPELQTRVDLVGLDGRGGVVATRRAEDGGAAVLDLITFPLEPDAGASVLTTDPFSSPGGSAASLEPWPHR